MWGSSSQQFLKSHWALIYSLLVTAQALLTMQDWEKKSFVSSKYLLLVKRDKAAFNIIFKISIMRTYLSTVHFIVNSSGCFLFQLHSSLGVLQDKYCSVLRGKYCRNYEEWSHYISCLGSLVLNSAEGLSGFLCGKKIQGKKTRYKTTFSCFVIITVRWSRNWTGLT